MADLFKDKRVIDWCGLQEYFLEFPVTLKKNSEQFCLKRPISDIQRVMGS